MEIGNLITRHARYRPQHLAVVFEETRLTYDQFNRRINRLSHAMLAAGVKRGDRVATLLPNSLELLDIYWAAAKIGAVAVPLSPMLLGAGLVTLLNDAEPVLLFSNQSLKPVLDGIHSQVPGTRFVLTDGAAEGYLSYAAITGKASEEEPAEIGLHGEDICHIMYTSGTTGQPKGIVITHRARAHYAVLMSNAFRMAPEAIVLQTGSLVFNGAMAMLLCCAFVGGTYVLHRQFDAEALIASIAQEKVTHTMMVPSQIIAMMASPNYQPEQLQSLEMILSLGAPLHVEHKERLNRSLPNRFYELYGLTEGFFTILDRDDAIRKQGSVGVPTGFSSMRILDEQGKELPAREVGEIAGRSPIQMSGYYKRPDLTRLALVDGWLHTGDLGYVDEDGYLYLVDRMKDMIDSGGVKVYPRDIEEVVVQHPAVLDVAVFGIPHEKWGETPLAAVLLKKGASPVTAEELKAWINERVSARYQRVNEVVIMEDFPRSTAGKTLKRELRAPYWADRQTKL